MGKKLKWNMFYDSEQITAISHCDSAGQAATGVRGKTAILTRQAVYELDSETRLIGGI